MSENFNDFPPSTASPSIRPDAFSSSPELNKLFESLARAQGEMKPAVMDMKNPHYNSRYASLTSCQEAYGAPLAKHGLSIVQQVYSVDSRFFLRSILGHSSGQWLSNIFELMIDRKNMQGLGSAVSYARRYGINSLVGVVDTEDDDGEAAIAGGKPSAPAAASNALTQPQIARIFHIASQHGWTHDQVKIFMKTRFEISATKDLNREQYDELVATIQTASFDQACGTTNELSY